MIGSNRSKISRIILRSLAVSLVLACLFSNPIKLFQSGTLSFSPAQVARADYGNGTVTADSVNVRDKPGTVGTKVCWMIYSGCRVECFEVVTVSNDPSGHNTWCHIEFTAPDGLHHGGYIVDDFIVRDDALKTDDAFEQEIAAFPESYKFYLRALHTSHPTWHFVPLNVNHDFNDVVDREARQGVSLIENTVDDSWKSVEKWAYNWQTGEYIPADGKIWVNAARGVVAHYVDPRNMLSEQAVFQFLELSYDPAHQTIWNVHDILAGSFMEFGRMPTLDGSAQLSYADAFMLAAEQSGANPVFLAAKVLQEVSPQGSGSSSGNYYSSAYNRQYTGLYNFYNIGASSDTDPVARGLAFARDGKDATYNERFMLPWNSPARSIIGGAKWIASSYIAVGQSSTYLMKFNVNQTDSTLYCKHQYMTNIRGAESEGQKMFKAYQKGGVLEQELYFTIPVYQNMPENPCAMPTNGNPNNYLKSLSVAGQNLTPSFDTVNCMEYSVVVPASCNKVQIDAVTASPNATVSGAGVVPIGAGVNEIPITVTAQSGATRTYTLYVARNIEAYSNYFETDIPSNDCYFGGIAPGATIAEVKARFQLAEGYTLTYMNQNGEVKSDTDKVTTGDLIDISDSTGKSVYIGTLFIRGDANGDGKISSADLTLIVRYILRQSTMTGAGIMGADANNDGKVSAADLTLICKTILGESTITP